MMFMTLKILKNASKYDIPVHWFQSYAVSIDIKVNLPIFKLICKNIMCVALSVFTIF